MTDIQSIGAISVNPTPRDEYPAVAAFITSDPDSESYVFRKFNNLTARKLLWLQSELLELEERLSVFDREAATSPDYEFHLSARSWEKLMANAQTRDGERQRKVLIDEIDVKLYRYHRALLLQREIARLEKPPDRVLSAYKEALHGIDGKDPRLGGKAQYILDDEDDLAMLNPPIHNDAMSHFFRKYWFLGQHAAGHGSRTRYFEERSLTWIVNICSTAIAATLLLGSILALFFVDNENSRLTIVLAFIVLFALGLSISTGASRDAIFAATAAYAAVLIVYISGDAGSTSRGGGSSQMCNATISA